MQGSATPLPFADLNPPLGHVNHVFCRKSLPRAERRSYFSSISGRRNTMRRKFLGRGLGMGLLALAGTCQASGSTLPAVHHASGLEGRIQALLSAYAANRSDQVLAMLDPQGWVVFGSDVAEIVRSNSALLEMMQADFALWKTAAISNIRDLNIQTDGTLASAMFHVDFSAGGRPPIPVRFCTTWRQIEGTWMLSQCANTVPTIHSSAAEILRR